MWPGYYFHNNWIRTHCRPTLCLVLMAGAGGRRNRPAPPTRCRLSPLTLLQLLSAELQYLDMQQARGTCNICQQRLRDLPLLQPHTGREWGTSADSWSPSSSAPPSPSWQGPHPMMSRRSCYGNDDVPIQKTLHINRFPLFRHMHSAQNQ